MIEFRFVRRFGELILQERHINLQIGWSKCDDTPVIQPQSPISLVAEKNWTRWKDVPVVEETYPGEESRAV